MNRHFSKDGMQITNGYMNECSTLLFRGIQIKIKMKCHLMPVGMATLKRSKGKCWTGCELKFYMFMGM